MGGLRPRDGQGSKQGGIGVRGAHHDECTISVEYFLARLVLLRGQVLRDSKKVQLKGEEAGQMGGPRGHAQRAILGK